MGPFKGWPDKLVIWMPSVFAFNFQVFFNCLHLISFLVPFEKLAKMMDITMNFTDKFNINAYN